MTDQMHLAEPNIGRRVAATDDPRVQDFMDALDAGHGLGKRLPGFVSRMEGSGGPGKGHTETKIGGANRQIDRLKQRLDPVEGRFDRIDGLPHAAGFGVF